MTRAEQKAFAKGCIWAMFASTLLVAAAIAVWESAHA